MPRKFSPPKWSRTWQAWNKVEEICADGEWHRWDDMVEAIMYEAGILRVTAVRILGEAYRYGVLWKRGSVAGFGRGARVDTRMVKIPEPGDADTGIDRVAPALKPPSRSEGMTAGPASRAADEQTSRVEYEREKSTGKSRPRPAPTPLPNVNVEEERKPVNPPDKTFTLAEAQKLQAKAERNAARRRIPGQPSGY
jgi:hypothetical protein